MREVLLHRDDADICGSCRGTWLPPGAMERLSRGRYGRKPSSTSANTSVPSPFGPPPVSSPTNPFGPPPASPRTPTTSPPASPPEPVTTAPVPASTSSPAPPSVTVPEPVPPPPETSALPEPSSAATSSFGMRPQLHVGKAAPRSVPQQPLENAASRGTGVDRGFSLKLLVGFSAVVLLAILAVVGTLLVGGDKEEQAEVVVTSSSTTSTEKYGAYLRHYRFGGRNLDWWSARLTELAPGGAAADAKAYALTKARAERLGLVVDEKPGRVDVSLSEPLVARLLERLEVR